MSRYTSAGVTGLKILARRARAAVTKARAESLPRQEISDPAQARETLDP
jgi:hypothetical protein